MLCISSCILKQLNIIFDYFHTNTGRITNLDSVKPKFSPYWEIQGQSFNYSRSPSKLYISFIDHPSCITLPPFWRLLFINIGFGKHVRNASSTGAAITAITAKWTYLLLLIFLFSLQVSHLYLIVTDLVTSSEFFPPEYPPHWDIPTRSLDIPLAYGLPRYLR